MGPTLIKRNSKRINTIYTPAHCAGRGYASGWSGSTRTAPAAADSFAAQVSVLAARLAAHAQSPALPPTPAYSPAASIGDFLFTVVDYCVC
eukprot:4354894-Pyramimonas_sp.AAC.2